MQYSLGDLPTTLQDLSQGCIFFRILGPLLSLDIMVAIVSVVICKEPRFRCLAVVVEVVKAVFAVYIQF